jgi:uncharacterized membrane protein HdeD (DUF308 family)
MTAWKRWQDYATMAIGVILFLTPFVFGATGSGVAAGTAYALGVLLFLSGILAAAMDEANGAEIIPAVLGVVTFIAPWALGFTSVAALAWSAWVLGILVVLSAGEVLYVASSRRRPRIA